MSKSDWDFVNFSQDHELNYILTYKLGVAANNANRELLRKIGVEAKASLNKGAFMGALSNITHDEFYTYIKNNRHKIRFA